MTRDNALKRICSALKPNEEITVQVSYPGIYNGVDVYTLTCNGYKYAGHKWHEHGTLQDAYRKYYIKRKDDRKC